MNSKTEKDLLKIYYKLVYKFFLQLYLIVPFVN